MLVAKSVLELPKHHISAELFECPFNNNYIQYFWYNLVEGRYGSIFPKHQVVLNGKAAIINCMTFKKAVWTINGMPVDLALRTPDNNLNFHAAYEKDSGIYECNGTYTNLKHFSVKAELLVASKLTEWNCVTACTFCF